MADAKEDLRKIFKSARDAISYRFVRDHCAQIQRRILDSSSYSQSRTVALYAAAGGEVSTDLIFTEAIASGRCVLFPRLDRATNELVLCRVSGPQDLAPGAFGILEPQFEEIMDVSTLGRSTMIVPGVAFSSRCERIGRGGGHYDRLLSKVGAQTVTIGLAYSFQVLDRVPQSLWDRRLDYVATESRFHRAAREVRWSRETRIEGGVPR